MQQPAGTDFLPRSEMVRYLASDTDARRLSACSLQAQGLYLRLALLASGTAGQIAGDAANVARLLGVEEGEFSRLLTDLERAGTVAVNGSISVLSLRRRESARGRQEKSRKKCDVTRDVTPERVTSHPPPALPPADASLIDCHPGYNPELVPVAKRILEHYQKGVQPTHPLQVGVSQVAVIRLLRSGKTEPQLRAAADHYAAHCRQSNTERQHRLAAKTFYGDGRAWEEYLQKPQADAPQGPRQQSMAELIEERKRALGTPGARGFDPAGS